MFDEEVTFVVDVETTGLDFRKEKVIEIAAVKLVNREIKDTFDSLVNPMQHIRHSSINIHGITEQMILEAPTIEEILPQFLDFIEDKPIIGHNVIFDYSFLNQASLTLYGKELSNKRIDTLAMFKEVFPDERSHGLSVLLSKFGVELETHHRALADAHGLAKVFYKLNDIYEERFSWQISQLERMNYLFERYLRIQNLIQSLQSEMADIKSIFKIYFERGGEPITAVTGETLSYNTKMNYQYDIEKLKAIIDELGLSEKVLKVNTGMLEKVINGSFIDEEHRDKLRNTRLFLSEQSTVTILKPDKTNGYD